jgi:hypothetical protein
LKKNDPTLDLWRDVTEVQVSPARLTNNLIAYSEILKEIQKLRELDLTDTHPAVIFEPTAAYRSLN